MHSYTAGVGSFVGSKDAAGSAGEHTERIIGEGMGGVADRNAFVCGGASEERPFDSRRALAERAYRDDRSRARPTFVDYGWPFCGNKRTAGGIFFDRCTRLE